MTFEHCVNPGEEEVFLRKWKASSDIIQKEPGALGSRIFRRMDRAADEPIFYIMADWDDKTSRDRALKAIKKRGTVIEDHNGHVWKTMIDEYELIDESLVPES
jgi:heme-degrading monooxygenase HmoA